MADFGPARHVAPVHRSRRDLLGALWHLAGTTGMVSAAGATGATGVLVACGPAPSDRRLLSEAPLAVQPAPTPAAGSFPPVTFPTDEAPHNALAEWWYYTGHLYTGLSSAPSPRDEEFGFELVFFRGIRGDRPPGYAAHFAITDVPRQRFRYDQRVDVALNELAAPRIDRPVGFQAPGGAGAAPEPVATRPPGVIGTVPITGGFDLAMGTWRIRGGNGRDILAADMPGYKLYADLTATRPPALHTGEPPLQPGLISFGPAGHSYYYSRTRMTITGTLQVDSTGLRAVRGDAWMDHQWGNFLVLGGGGWDWFAANLKDGRDLTFSVIRDATGATTLAYGTLVDARGASHHLPPAAFTVSATGAWTSPRTGIRYPSGWRVTVPQEGLDLIWTPLLADQELDTRQSTGVIYWEGAVAVADAAGRDLGRGYVELTGYANKA